MKTSCHFNNQWNNEYETLDFITFSFGFTKDSSPYGRSLHVSIGLLGLIFGFEIEE